MITLNSVSKSFGSKTLFENVTMTFNPGVRYGLTGPNGAGKTTLFKIICGLEEPTNGSVSLPQKVGILKQNISGFRENTLIDVVLMGNPRLWETFQERDQLYQQDITEEVGMRLGELEEIVEEENGYMAESDAEMLLTGIGIPEEDHEKAMHMIPNDIQFRVLLCQAIFGNPQALLLDEPTNHLDLESIRWLENFLKNYTGTLIVISHDRHFLNAVTTSIADIDYETIIEYPGNYDDMVVAKTSVHERAEHEAKSREKKAAKLREFVSKFSAGTRASQVQSRLKEIERLKPQELKKSNIQRPYIRFYPPEVQPGKIVLKVENLSKSYDDNQVIENFSLEIDRGDKIAIIGNNGKGKTTLIKMLADVLAPDGGEVCYGHNVSLSYFPQDHAEMVDKNDDQNGFEWLKSRYSNIYDQDIRGALGKMLFGGDDAFKAVGALSGGETARLILAKMMLDKANIIILDEPDNHLDIEAVSALAWGLEDYPGTAIFASHNRDLIDHAATKIIAFEDDGIKISKGNLEEYLER
ncbi:MAG: ABC-F family ATP-binding cassette domain-containing protein [Chlamydiota bacterium]